MTSSGPDDSGTTNAAPPPDLTPTQILEIVCERLNLKPREREVLRNCLWAWTQVSNGNYLLPPSRVPASERLIVRGYLTKAKDQPVPFDPKGFGMVVVLEQTNIGRLIEDANATLKPAAPPLITCPECGATGTAFNCDKPECPVNGGAAHG